MTDVKPNDARAEAERRYGTPRESDLLPSDYVTIGQIEGFIEGRLAAGRAETTTEWGVRSEWTPTTAHFDNEHDARAFAARIEGRVVVRREVTAWMEAE